MNAKSFKVLFTLEHFFLCLYIECVYVCVLSFCEYIHINRNDSIIRIARNIHDMIYSSHCQLAEEMKDIKHVSIVI